MDKTKTTFRTGRVAYAMLLSAGIALASACQSPTDPDETVDVDDFLETSVSPDPAIAGPCTDGRTYRVVRGNNQPDDILLFDWCTSFTLAIKLNDKADDDDTLTFPVDLTSTSIKVNQASGGIVTPPTGGEIEHFDQVITASSNRFGAINSGMNVTFDVWYDLPSLRKEALITVTLALRDTDGVTFSKAVEVKVAP